MREPRQNRIRPQHNGNFMKECHPRNGCFSANRTGEEQAPLEAAYIKREHDLYCGVTAALLVLSMAALMFDFRLGLPALHILCVGLLWCTLAVGVVAYAYKMNDCTIFGKTDGGRLSPSAVFVLLPYLAVHRLRHFFVTVVSRENRADLLLPGIYMGSRPASASSMPQSVTVCVDLSAEFPEHRSVSVNSRIRYISFPILEASVRKIDDLLSCIDALPESGIYIHCSQGHGRTGFFCAALLLRRGLTADVSGAESFLQSRRPALRLRKGQRKFLEDHLADFLRRGDNRQDNAPAAASG